MNYQGIIIGVITFLLIGVFHPIVIKSEYYFSKRIWPVFLVIGIGALIATVFIPNIIISALVAVFSISCFWSILELFEQEERVKKGWFPANPKRQEKHPEKPIVETKNPLETTQDSSKSARI